uniref:ABC-2 family transporter protein n=1 Tax=Candidatus Fimivicinus sp. TaxID=3056640 RepID=UPI003FEE2421
MEGIVMLIVAFSQNGIRWTLPRILMLFMVVGDTPVFCLFLLYAAFSFVTLEDLEFMNVLTYGGRELGQYPFAIYGKMVLTFCTVVVPYAWFQQIPLDYPTDGSENLLRMFAPCTG